jgi:isopenicillin N synthase-like dioxygenase
LIADTFAASAAFFRPAGRGQACDGDRPARQQPRLCGPGIEALDEKSGADHKEAFNLIWTDGSSRPANVWPELPGFQAVVQRYFDACSRSDASCIRPSRWTWGSKRTSSPTRSIVPWPPCACCTIRVPLADAPLGQIGAGAHTDYGNVTLLATDGVAGLQVRRRTAPGSTRRRCRAAFICNIGDCLMRWTNDIYVSTPHRVLRPAAERYSIAMFVDPNPERSCVRSLLRAGRRVAPPCADQRHDYLQQRFASTYGRDRAELAYERGASAAARRGRR